MYHIEVSAPAEHDISSIIGYIRHTLKNPTAADSHLNEIEQRLIDLKTMPLKYPKVTEPYLADKKIRSFLIKNYFVFYRVNEGNRTVTIIRLLYARSNWSDILHHSKSN